MLTGDDAASGGREVCKAWWSVIARPAAAVAAFTLLVHKILFGTGCST